MSYDSLERSANSGSRVELYLFEIEGTSFYWAYTTDKKPITLFNKEFVPHPIRRDELKQNAGQGGTERLTITVPWDNPVAALHVPYLPPKPVKVTVYSYQRRDLSVEIKQGFIGYIAAFAQKKFEAELSCSQIIDTFQQIVPWATYKPNCVWATYGDGCFINKEDFRHDIVVLSLDDTDASVKSNALAEKPDDWFRAGFAFNPETGETRFIVEHKADTIKLVHPFTNLKPGDTLRCYAGDDRTEKTCREKFNNKARFLAFDHTAEYNVFDKGTG